MESWWSWDRPAGEWHLYFCRRCGQANARIPEQGAGRLCRLCGYGSVHPGRRVVKVIRRFKRRRKGSPVCKPERENRALDSADVAFVRPFGAEQLQSEDPMLEEMPDEER